VTTNITALASEIAADPSQAGYAALSDQQVADKLNVPAQQDVPAQLVMDTCMTRGAWGAIELLSRGTATGVTAHDQAPRRSRWCGSARRRPRAACR
jgi:hypothetical protein